MRATASRRQALVFPAALLIASSQHRPKTSRLTPLRRAPAPAGDAPPPSLPTPPPSLPTPPPRPSAVAAVQAEAKPFDPSRRGAFNEKALFEEDFYFKFGVAPKFKDGVVELPKGADLPFSPVKRRRAMATLCFAVAHPGPRSLAPRRGSRFPRARAGEAYAKFATRLNDGVAAVTFELSSALAAGDQKTVAEITRPVAKGFEGTPVSNLPYVMGLLANQCLQSENEGTTNANFLARYMANEVDFAVRDMNAARPRATRAA